MSLRVIDLYVNNILMKKSPFDYLAMLGKDTLAPSSCSLLNLRIIVHYYFLIPGMILFAYLLIYLSTNVQNYERENYV